VPLLPALLRQRDRLNRRSLLAGIVFISASRPLKARAQETTPVAIASPAASFGGIRPTGVGEVPTTGARRPGPANSVGSPVGPEGVAPIELTIDKAGIDAGIETLRVVDGSMQDPSGPWIVAWYENLGSLGRIGNVVMAGHIDYWNVGPSVFYNLATLVPGDEIIVSGQDGKQYPFTVDWIRQYDSDSIPLDEVAGPTDQQSLTLITCGGAFDYVNGHYLQRTVVRAIRSGPGLSASA
jgi:hypothetical protein